MPLVAVVGSANLDYVIHADRAPEPGETILGTQLSQHAGGKGLNQAVAAAGVSRTALVGAIGNDNAGSGLRAVLARVDDA